VTICVINFSIVLHCKYCCNAALGCNTIIHSFVHDTDDKVVLQCMIISATWSSHPG